MLCDFTCSVALDSVGWFGLLLFSVLIWYLVLHYLFGTLLRSRICVFGFEFAFVVLNLDCFVA